MIENKKYHIVLFISGNTLFIHSENLQTMAQLDVPADAARDLDIVNSEKFAQTIHTFLSAHAITGGIVTIVFAHDACFEKDFQNEEELNKNLNTFLESVPFEETLYRIYHVNKRTRVSVVNRQYCLVLKKFFQTNGFLIQAFVPVSLLQETIPDLQSRIDLTVILKKIDVAKQFDLFFDEPAANTAATIPEKSQEKNRLFLLLGIFAFLIIILVIVVAATR